MWAAFMILLFSGGGLSYRETRFTNIKCNALNPSYCAYEKCHLKMVARGIVGLNLHMKLLKGPIRNAKINLKLYRKYNGFRPFMFNVTFDLCKFMSQSSGRLSIQKIVFDALATKSNLNHSCPYENEIVIDKFILKEELLKFLPLPSGEYQIQASGGTDNEWITKVAVNMLLSEDP